MSDSTPADAPKPAAKKPAVKKPAAAKPAAKKPAAAKPPVPPAPPAPPAAVAPPAPAPAPAAAAPVYAPPQPLSPDEERNISMLSHLITLIALVLSLSWLSALIFFLLYRDRGAFVRAHTTTELNFQITMVLAAVAGVLLSFVGIGLLVVLAVPVLMIVFGIIATMKASRGEWYVYPVAIRFLH